jgi:hypothetical protein
MQKTIGGDRLGAGNKLKVELKNYERSTHDLGYIWRSTMAAGTLVPFMTELALPGDTFDIELNCDVKTHPTLGPLFGSYKVQLDVFEAPIRLYHSALHNNMLAIGNNMQNVLLPQIQANNVTGITALPGDLDNAQINPSSLFAYLGIRGWGFSTTTVAPRSFSAIPFLAYWEIYKNYYANKQETVGYYIENQTATATTVTAVTLNSVSIPNPGPIGTPVLTFAGMSASIQYSGTAPDVNQILFTSQEIGDHPASQYFNWGTPSAGTIPVINTIIQGVHITGWHYLPVQTGIKMVQFPLSVIDAKRTSILQTAPTNRYTTTSAESAPYGPPLITSAGSQMGLGLKTYQSDLFNNWVSTTWLDAINTTSAVSTVGNSFTIDSLVLARKVYDMLNRIAVSGGTYDDWIDAAYSHEHYTKCETPMYHGGLSKELVFQQTVSLAATNNQPLGTLAGRGALGDKHKGGKITIKCNEPSYIIGIVSLTPRIDYSQGNKWDTHLSTMDDLHKPGLDQIGFQNLITEQMAWWDTHWNGSAWVTKSAGRQPAWINYMTNYNRNYGNFAIASNEMFMTLNRQYTPDSTTFQIKDLTTYIDPSHYNFIFAETALDAQNFWVQIALDITARRKMSAKVMPNL